MQRVIEYPALRLGLCRDEPWVILVVLIRLRQGRLDRLTLCSGQATTYAALLHNTPICRRCSSLDLGLKDPGPHHGLQPIERWGSRCGAVLAESGKLNHDRRDVISTGLVLQPQPVRLHYNSLGSQRGIALLGHDIDDGLALQELEDAVAGDDEEGVVGSDFADQSLRLRPHAQALGGAVADGAREGCAGICALGRPDSWGISIVVLLVAPLLDPGHSGPAPLHARALVLAVRRLVVRQVHRHQAVLPGIILRDHGARVAHVGHPNVAPPHRHGHSRAAAHGVVDGLCMQHLVGEDEAVAMGALKVRVQAPMPCQEPRNLLLGELRALRAKLAVPVEHPEEVRVGISRHLLNAAEGVLVGLVGLFWIVAALRHVGISDGVSVLGHLHLFHLLVADDAAAHLVSAQGAGVTVELVKGVLLGGHATSIGRNVRAWDRPTERPQGH
eukprot:scaffold1275_cov401-Prasinococcus_capsulatus_cf.AAC.9